MNRFRYFVAAAAMTCLIPQGGCIKSEAIGQASPFETQELDACLAIVVDMSGSFSNSWDDRAYDLFLNLSDRFFTEGMGSDSRLIISQLSGDEKAVLFDGKPSDLRRRFQSPEQLGQFLKEHSDPSMSRVFDSTTSTLNYVRSLPGVTKRTRLLTVIMSDMLDTESNADKRILSGRRMVDALKSYREAGGGLALYFVATDEISRWQTIMSESGFEPGHYVIENELTQSPQLPRFE